MADTKKKDSEPDTGLTAATPKPERSRTGDIQHTRRGVRPERRIESQLASPLETGTRIAAEFIAQDAAEKTKLAAEADRANLVLAREPAREKDERRAAATVAEARLAAVHQDLADVHDDVAATRKSLSRERTIRVAAGFAAAALICAAVLYQSMPGIPELPVSPLAPRSQEALDSPEARFAQGLDRLNLTLASAMGGQPEEAIRAIRTTRSPAVCPFVWRNGQVSLTFTEDTNLSSLTNTFARCADALAQLP